MMLQLRGSSLDFRLTKKGRHLLTVTTNPAIPNPLKSRFAFLMRSNSEKHTQLSFGALLTFGSDRIPVDYDADYLVLPSTMDYLADGDIISYSEEGKIWVLFRKEAKYNTFLLTERCNHLCLMCSQPPKKKDDGWLLEQAMCATDLIPKTTTRFGFSGGEPTLYGEGLIKLIEKCAGILPFTTIDILTNGRAFSDPSYAKSLANIGHKSCQLCIPLYSHIPEVHDYVVQARGAFDETIDGILNLKALNQKVEIRIVIHKQTIQSLVETCQYITKNLRFVDHVALMGLEITGFTRANFDSLWIDPYEYKDILSEAVNVLNLSKIRNSVYNHQLCIINQDIEKNYVHSISDWKNEYLDICKDCTRRADCGGFFSSSLLHQHSSHIQPFS
jgi:His-Xaa-Ser system radical SAM maturase HxsC